jgi:hypothetical protein
MSRLLNTQAQGADRIQTTHAHFPLSFSALRVLASSSPLVLSLPPSSAMKILLFPPPPPSPSDLRLHWSHLRLRTSNQPGGLCSLQYRAACALSPLPVCVCVCVCVCACACARVRACYYPAWGPMQLALHRRLCMCAFQPLARSTTQHTTTSAGARVAGAPTIYLCMAGGGIGGGGALVRGYVVAACTNARTAFGACRNCCGIAEGR